MPPPPLRMGLGPHANGGGPAAFLQLSQDHLVNQQQLHENIYHQANTISHLHEKYQQQQNGYYGGQVFNDYTPPLPPLRNEELPMTGTLKVAAVHHTMQRSPMPPELPVRNGVTTMGHQRNKVNGGRSICQGNEIEVGNGRRTMTGRHFH